MKHVTVPAGAPCVTVAWRAPFSLEAPQVSAVPAGATVAEIVAAQPGLPEAFDARGVVALNGHLLERAHWHRIRPRAGTRERPVVLTLHLPPRGGGQGGSAGKTAMALVAAIALTAVTAGVASGAILGGASAALAGAFGISTSVAAAGLAGTIGIVGSLAIAALTPAPAVPRASGGADDAKGPASIAGNVLAPGASLPRVVGTALVYPALAGDPIIELVDDDEYATAAVVLAGPHAWDAIRIGDALIEEADDVTWAALEGWPDDPDIDWLGRQGKLEAPNVELSAHIVNPDDQDALRYPDRPETCLPVWHQVASRKAPDEIWLHLLLPTGLGEPGDPSDDKAVPLRIQIRRRGDADWISLPEVHLSGRKPSPVRRAILIRWAPAPESIPGVPQRSGWVAAFKAVPAQVGAGGLGPWAAHASFSAGAGADALYSGVEGSTNVRNCILRDNRVEFFLDSGVFPKGIYEVRLKRGAAYDASTFTKSSYTYGGNVLDFFGHQAGAIPMSRENIADQMMVSRLQSIWREPLLPAKGQAVIAVRARNRAIESISAIASGYVRDWDGSAWSDWTTTSNPAPHYRDVLVGPQNLDPLPADLLDEAGLVAWRQRCIDDGLTCDAVFEGGGLAEVLDIIASCGYARRYHADLWGVIQDYDRSGEGIVQLVSSRVAWDIRWERAFPRLPDGLRVSYRDAAADYAEAEAIVYRDGYEGGAGGRFEGVAYQGLVAEADVRARALFDLRQAELRGTFYRFTCPPLFLVARRGSLIGLQHDTLHRPAGAARLKRKVLSEDASEIVALELDSEVPVATEGGVWDVADVWAVASVWDVGARTGIAIRRTDGSVSVHEVSSATGETATVVLATPIPAAAPIEDAYENGDRVRSAGALVTLGRLASEYRRLIVTGITYDAALNASVTAVDEAPELWPPPAVIAAIITISGALGGTVEAVGAIAGSITIDGAVEVGGDEVGQIVATLEVDGVLAGGIGTTGSISGSITIAAAADGYEDPVVAEIAGTISLAGSLAGSFEAAGGVAGSVEITIAAAGMVSAAGSIAGAVEVAGTVAPAASELEGEIAGTVTIAAAVDGAVSRSAALAGTIALDGSAGALAEMAGVAAGTITVAGALVGQRQTPGAIAGSIAVDGAAEAELIPGGPSGPIVVETNQYSGGTVSANFSVSHDIGTASTYRVVLVGVSMYGFGGITYGGVISGVTIAGVSALRLVASSVVADGAYCEIWAAVVPSGSGAQTIGVTFSDAPVSGNYRVVTQALTGVDVSDMLGAASSFANSASSAVINLGMTVEDGGSFIFAISRSGTRDHSGWPGSSTITTTTGFGMFFEAEVSAGAKTMDVTLVGGNSTYRTGAAVEIRRAP